MPPITEAEMDAVGLGPEERAALEGADEERMDPNQVANAEKEDKEVDQETDAEKQAREAAEAQAAEDKAAQEAEAKRKAELEAMSAEDRAKAEAADKAAREAADKAAKEEADRTAREQQQADAGNAEPLITTYHAEAPADYDKKVAALDTRADEAATKFKAGEMTFDAFREEEKKINAERRELDEQRLKHEISKEQTEQAAKSRWQWECDNFFRTTAKTDSVDYKANPRLWAALDSEVKRLGALEENNDKPGVWFLEEAHKVVVSDFGLGRKPAAENPKDKAERERKEAIAREKKERDAASGNPVRTLGSLPPASGEDEGKDEFAHLDKLDGMDLELALAKLPKEDADRYLRGGA